METGNDKTKTVHTADTSNIAKNPSEFESVERKDKYLKRLKLENEIGKKAFERVEQWIEIERNKVLIKSKNRAGSVYSSYFFNGKRYVDELANLKRTGFWPMPNGEGKAPIKIELRTIDGRPFKKAPKE